MRGPTKPYKSDHGGYAPFLFAFFIFAVLMVLPLFGEVGYDRGHDNPELVNESTGESQPLPAEKGSTRSQPEYHELISYDDVLVVRNLNSAMSMQIADYFIAKRNIPPLHICNITTSTSETVSRTVFEDEIRTPVEDHIINNGLIGTINYIVTNKGIPLRISEEDPSDDGIYAWDRACVDSDLALIIGAHQGAIGQPYWYDNPYFDPDPKEEFSMWNYSFFLVTRFTGYDWNDIKPLIDKPEIAIGRQGTFVLDVDPGRDGGGYQVGNDWMRDANTTLTANGFDVYLDETITFLTNQNNASGYTSWGSNDGHYPTNSLSNTGLENDGNGDGIPDSWYYENEGAVGFCERNDTEIRNGAWSVKIERNATSDNATFFAQNYTVKPDTRYYAVGYVNLSGVSVEQGVHLQFRAFDSQGNVIQYYNGTAQTGTTSNWVSLYQKHFEPIDGVTQISVGVALSKSSGIVYVDDIYLYEIKPHNDWIPGALAETYVSTGGRSFNYPTTYGQSLVADLIRDGVTGTKGYVYEPFLDACAHPDILFDAYTQGFNLAESYYMASTWVSWMDVVVGDPKVAPYRKDIIPDLSVNVQDFLLSTTEPITGENVDITATIENLGPTDATEVMVSFYLEDPVNGSVLIGSRIIDVEGSGSNVTSITWDTTGYWGDFNISVVVDAQDRYFEADESNNNATRTITVHNGFPVADAGSDTAINEDAFCLFDGSGSASNSSIVNYTWDFDDGTFGYGVSPSHTYTAQGLYAVTLNITNTFGLWDTDTVEITVNNVPPTAHAGNDMFDFEGASFELNGSLSTDTVSDMGTLNYTWLFGDGNTGYGMIVTHTYEDDGVYIATLEVMDDDGIMSSDIVNITVSNAPPSITQITDQLAWEDVQFTLQVEASDIPQDTLTYSDNTTLFDIDSATGEINFTPVNSDVGVYLINISVTDDDGGLNLTIFQLTVVNTNDPPIIVSAPATGATENAPYEYTVIVEDDDFSVDPSETIMYSLDSAPSGMDIDTSGKITWIPSDDQAGLSFEVIVNVSDGESFDFQVFNVTVTNINDGPTITSDPITDAVEDEAFSYDVNATDMDPGDVLEYSLEKAPAGMTIDPATGIITWLPENGDVGDHEIVVNVSDIDGAYDIQTFTITVENVNDPPLLQDISELTATEDEPFQFQVVVTDVDLFDELTFYDDSDLFDIDAETGNISFTPGNDDVGIYTVKIWVEDDSGESDEVTITFTVGNVNDPPVLDFIPDILATEDETFMATVSASDIDEEDSFTFGDNTTLFEIDADSGVISFTPTNEDVGEHVVNISVMDGNGGLDYQEIVVIVENVNDSPHIPDTVKNELSQDIELKPGDSFIYTILVDDPDRDDDLTFSDDTDLFDINPNTGEIIFVPKGEDAGTHTVTITVTDSQGDEDHITLTFTIAEEKDEGNSVMLALLLLIPLVVIVFLIVMIILRSKKKGGPPVAEPVEFSEFQTVEESGQVFTPMVPVPEDQKAPEPGPPPGL